MLNWLRPRYFILGILLGIVACSIAGYMISLKARFNHFIRFTSYISTSLNYYPLASELLATAQHKVSPDKILVLIGGSSIMRGDGQNEDDLWSQRLQQLLGEKYQVLNYGYNGASVSAFGSVAYRVLSEYYKRIIFVSTCTYSEEANIDGGKTYGYLFWDAYYKNLFHPDANEQKKINSLRRLQLKSYEGIELHAMSYLDSIFYFRNLWNWFSYRYLFTVYDKNTFPFPFRARRYFPDDKVDNVALADSVHKDTERFKHETESLVKSEYHQFIDPQTHRYIEGEIKRINGIYANIFEPILRNKMLCYISPYNPKHLSVLTKQDEESYQFMIENTGNIIKSLGYHAIAGRNFTPNDYIDLMHYVASGGNKVALQIAPQIELIAKEQGYV